LNAPLAGLAAACVIVTIMIPREQTLVVPLPALVMPPLPVMVKAIEKPERFPTAAALTREERALLALADTNAFAESEDAGITPTGRPRKPVRQCRRRRAN
jgi:hypothetical protein